MPKIVKDDGRLIITSEDEVEAILSEPYVFDSSELAMASLSALRWIKEHKTYRLFTWPGEVESMEPMLVDMTTANAVLTCYDALTKQENREKFERMIMASRAQFLKVVEICWRCIK